MARRTRTILLVGGAIGLVAAVAVGAWLLMKDHAKPPVSGTQAFRESADDVGIRFRMNFLPGEQGETFKINLYDHGCGLAVGDYDGDGHDDLFFTNQLGPCALYRNKGDGTFEETTKEAGVALGDRVCVAATFADYDGDGRRDLFVTSSRGGNVLFRNEGNGKFRDATKDAGLTLFAHSQTAVFFDADNDGDLDLFLANTAEWTTDSFDMAKRYFLGKGGAGLGEVIHSKKESNALYRNNGNGTFADVTEKAGLKGRGWAGDAVAFDYNDDGRLDLFVTSMFGRGQLYRNNPDGTFTDVTLEVLGKTPWGGVGTKVFDADNDGRLDLFVVDMHSDMWMGKDDRHRSLELVKRFQHRKFNYYNGPYAERDPSLVEDEKQLGREVGFKHEELLFGNAFYRNLGGGKFEEVSDKVGLETFWPWGMATGDFDNDGHEDVFVPAGMGYPFYYWPNSLLMNKGDGTFAERAAELGIEPPARGQNLPDKILGKAAVRSSRCAVTADFDGDGRLELVTNNFNDQPYYFKNQFPKKNYIALKLRGGKGNIDAIGAVVRLYRGDQVMTRQVQGACGYLSQSATTVHFGLGDRPDFDRIEITWPGGQKQKLDALAANKLHEVKAP